MLLEVKWGFNSGPQPRDTLAANEEVLTGQSKMP
jgi:hypothetical protein